MSILIATGCPDPQCDAHASAEELGSYWSTDGPVRHVATTCVAGHYFQGPALVLLARDRSGG